MLTNCWTHAWRLTVSAGISLFSIIAVERSQPRIIYVNERRVIKHITTLRGGTAVTTRKCLHICEHVPEQPDHYFLLLCAQSCPFVDVYALEKNKNMWNKHVEQSVLQSWGNKLNARQCHIFKATNDCLSFWRGKATNNETVIYLKLEMHNVLLVATQSMRSSFTSLLNITCFVKKHYVSSWLLMIFFPYWLNDH